MKQSTGEEGTTQRKCFRNLNRATLEFFMTIKGYIQRVKFHKARHKTTTIDYKAEQFLELILGVGTFAFQPAVLERTRSTPGL